MAKDLLFIPLSDESPQHFDRKVVTDILSKDAVHPVTDFYCEYADGGGRGEASGIDDDPAQTRPDHLGFTHFGGRTMMERIYELADALEVFLAWSDTFEGEPAACVTRDERLAMVREDARHLNVVVARDPSHLNLLVKGVSFEENGWI